MRIGLFVIAAALATLGTPAAGTAQSAPEPNYNLSHVSTIDERGVVLRSLPIRTEAGRLAGQADLLFKDGRVVQVLSLRDRKGMRPEDGEATVKVLGGGALSFGEDGGQGPEGTVSVVEAQRDQYVIIYLVILTYPDGTFDVLEVITVLRTDAPTDPDGQVP